jgi:Zn-dependent peptidase ImmA (M78 family)/transcriptional regulator with XRE-family HTH domain
MALSREQIAARLREHRESLGFTQAYVAAELGVHRPTISEIEAGRRAVTAEELYRLAVLYSASVAEILAEVPAGASDAAELLALRNDGATTPGVRRALKEFVNDREAEFELEEILGVSHPTSSTIRRDAVAPRNAADAVKQGELLANMERHQLGLGEAPITSILHLIARQGVRIGPLDAVESEPIDGVYFESADLGPCVGVTQRDGDWTGGRAAFTAAHEYAHVILRDTTSEVFALSPGECDVKEVRANAFAAAFLMPKEGLVAYFSDKGLLQDGVISRVTPADIVRAMDHFGVSRTALLFRLRNLGLISQDVAATLADFGVMSVANAAGIIFRDRQYFGTRLPELAIRAWRQGRISTGRAAGLCRQDLEEFMDTMRTMGEYQDVDDDAPLVGASASG